jgi:hypothetical protein
MDSHFHHRPSLGVTIWFGAFLLFTALVAGIAASFLIRRGRSSALLIALVVSIAFLLLEWPRAAINTEGRAERDTSRKSWFAMALVATATCAAYLPTLRMYFLADDFGDVQLYSHPSFRTFLRLFAMDQSQGIWGYLTQEFRPVVGLSYMVDYSLWGTNSVGYHLTAVLLHVVSSLAVFAIAKKAAALTNRGAALAGLLFALLPVHPESVAWINGSKVDALPSMCYLVGFLGFVSYRATGHARYIVLAAAGFVSSLMSKEIAVTFPAMLVSFDLVRWASRTQGISPDSAASGSASWRAMLFPYLLIGGLFVAYLVARGAIFPSVLREDRLAFSFREAFASLAGFRAQIGRLWPEFKGLHVYNLEQFLIELSPWSVGIVLGLALAWTVFIVRAGTRSGMLWVIFFGGAWYAIACLPLLVTYHSARHLYLPMAGPCIALACLASSGWTLLSSRARVVRVAGSVALVSILAVSLWTQINSWVRAGEISNRLHEGFVAALEATPKDAVIIAWAPYGISPSGWAPPWVWPWVMPFALQQPFVGHDLYAASPRLMEFPHMFCCPIEQWWEQKRSVLLSVLSGEPEELVEMRRLAWDERNGVVSRLRIAVPKKQLRALIEGVLGGPVEDAKTVSHATATKLMAAFMDLTAKRH